MQEALHNETSEVVVSGILVTNLQYADDTVLLAKTVYTSCLHVFKCECGQNQISSIHQKFDRKSWSLIKPLTVFINTSTLALS